MQSARNIQPPRQWLRALLPVLMILLLLSGCTVGPDYEKPLFALPASWGSAKDASRSRPPELASWWKRLNDPLLNELIEVAVARNLDVATSKAKIREARASYRQTAGALFPTASSSASATQGKSGSSSGGSADTYSQFQAGFDAKWEIDLFGANRRAVEAARYGLDAAEEDLRATLLTLVGDVTANYVELRGYQARITLGRRTAASQNETAALTRTKFEAGAASAVDVANASGQAASTEARLPELEAAMAKTAHRLSVLTGQPPATLMERLKKQAPIPRPKLPMPTGVPADILLARPDVRLAERQYAQATARIGQSEAARYPSISLSGDISTSGVRLGDLGKSSSISWSFGPTLTVPVFNAGKLAAAVDVARAQRDQTFIAYHASVLTALEDVENAIVSLAQERLRYNKLAASAGHYREAASLSGRLFEAGSASFLDLLTAQRSLYSAEDSLIASQVAIATDYIALNKALGGGWDGFFDALRPEIIDVNTRTGLARVSKSN